MGTPTPGLDEYRIESIKRLDSTDGSNSEWVTVRYVKKNKGIRISGTETCAGNTRKR